MNTYLYSYEYKGSMWAFEIKADSPKDAHARFVEIVRCAQYDGELMGTVPAFVPRWAIDIYVSIRNRLRR